MAVVKSHSLHGNVQRAITYIINPDKTDRDYIYSSCGSMPEVTGMMWELMNEAKGNYCNTQENGIVGWHYIMAFAYDEVDIDTCYRLAKEWIEKLYGDEYEYVLAVHTDQPQMHAHIILNPVSNKTGRSLHFSRSGIQEENQRMRQISDEICTREGLSVIENPQSSKSHSYFYWLHKNNPQWMELKDVLDKAIEEVSSYKDLRMYLEAMGFEFNDTYALEEEQRFEFTVNEVLYYPGGIDKDEEVDTLPCFVPKTQRQIFTKFSPDEYIMQGEGKQIKVQLDLKKYRDGFPVYDVLTHQQTVIPIQEFMEYWDDKTRNRNRLSIKVPGAQRFITSRALESKSGEDNYSYRAILKRIENNGRDQTDYDILAKIEEYQSLKSKKKRLAMQKQLFEEFKKQHKITTSYKDSAQSNMTRYDLFVNTSIREMIEIQKRWVEPPESIYNDYDKKQVMNEIDTIKGQLEWMKNPYRELSLKEVELEDAYRVIERQRQEGLLEMSEEELTSWVNKYLKPVQETRTSFKTKHAKLLDELDRLENLTLSDKELAEKKILKEEEKKNQKKKKNSIGEDKR